MSETTPQSSLVPNSCDLTDLADPVAAVIAVELARTFVRLCMCQTEPIVVRLARNEPTLRQPGGIELHKRIVSQRLYRLMDPDVFRGLAAAVPLAHAEYALSRMETLLRGQFADVIGAAASYLLSDGHDAAIQMATVATTMAAREVRGQVVEIIARTWQPTEEG